MIRKLLAGLPLVFISIISLGQGSKDELVAFNLKQKNKSIATIQVPAGYKEETYSYVEGVRTTLTYPDGSYIILHVGGMIKLPFFTEPEHVVSKRQNLPNRIVRYGKVHNTNLLWREENSVGVWPPTNIGFTNVPKERRALFVRALRTFALAKAKPQVSDDKPADNNCDFSSYKPLMISHFAITSAVKKVKPTYPPEAARQGAQGSVQVKILVNSEGDVEKACATGGDDLLRRASEEAALRWKFKPDFGFSGSSRHGAPKKKRYAVDFLLFRLVFN